MNPKTFTNRKTGHLRRFVRLDTGNEDWLFLPNELPAEWKLPDRLWPFVAEAREALGVLNGIGQTLPSPKLLQGPLRNSESISSSAIEGIYVTPQQLLLYDLNPSEPTSETDPVADWQEVVICREALQLGLQLSSQGPILNRDLLKMHEQLMSGVRGATKSPGKFRRDQVQIGLQGKYIPPPPEDLSRLMANLEKEINRARGRIDPLVACCMVHYQFEAIHPFAEGNGRLGRVLLSLMIYRSLQHSMPWLYLSEYFESHRGEYTDLLFRVSTHGDWEAWIEFCLSGAITQANRSIHKCSQLRALREEYHQRAQEYATSRTEGIIEYLFESPILDTPRVAEKFGVSFATAGKDLKRLTKAGILNCDERARPKNYSAYKLLRTAYDIPEVS